MAQQNATINGTLIFQGTFAGQASIQAQPIGGNLIFQLPNTLPTLNQLVAVEEISGNVVTLGFANPQSGGGSGTVTSVTVGNLSPLFTASVATGTTTPAITYTLSNAAANTFFAGPVSGSAAAPTFRAFSLADIPQSGATTSQVIQWSGTAWVPATISGGSGTVTSVSGAGIATGTVTTTGSITVAGSGNTTIAATAASNVHAAPAGDVITADGNGNVQDSGTLLSSLASQSFVTGQGYITSAGTATTISGSITESQVTGLSASLAALAPLASPAFTGGIGVTGDVTTTSGSLFVHGNNNGESVAQFFTGTLGTPASTEAVAIDGNGNLEILLGLKDNTGSLGTNGQVLTSTGSATLWATAGGSTPGGSSGEIQWNNGGSFAGVTGSTITAAGVSVLTADSAGLAINATSTAAVTINTATGVFEFFGTGGGMSLATANASIAIDSSGDVIISTATGAANMNLTASGQINLESATQFHGKLVDVNGGSGAANYFLSSNGGSSNVLWSPIASTQLSDTASLARQYDIGGNAPAAGDNHIASGTVTLVSGASSVTFTGGAIFADTNYVVHLTYNSVIGGAGGPQSLWASSLTETGFNINSTDGTDGSSVIGWTAIGY